MHNYVTRLMALLNTLLIPNLQFSCSQKLTSMRLPINTPTQRYVFTIKLRACKI